MEDNTQAPAAPAANVAAQAPTAGSSDAAARAIAKAAVTGQKVEAVPEGSEAPVVAVEAPKPGNKAAEFSALARKERDIVRKQNELKAKEADLDKLVESRIAAKMQELQQAFDKDPVEALKQYGRMDIGQLNNRFLNKNMPTPEDDIQRVRQELNEFKAAQTEAAKKAEEQVLTLKQQREEQAVSDFNESIVQFIGANTESLELVSLYDPQGATVYKTIEDYYDAYGKVLSTKEAAQLVEDYLAEEAAKVLNTKRFRQKEMAESSAQPAGEPGFTTRSSTSSKTLSNATSGVPSSLSPRNENDRVQRAIAALAKS